MAKQKVKFESFLSGLCSFWGLDENQVPVKLTGDIRFQDRVVGAKRNYLAEQAGHTIQRLIRIPKTDAIGSGCFAVINEQQYKVARVQLIPDAIPQCTDVTLEQPDLLLQFDPEEVGAGGRV